VLINPTRGDMAPKKQKTVGKLLLPSENSRTMDGSRSGWVIKTEVRQSGIPGAGNGRFAGDGSRHGHGSS
jgi:hypothetical protein